VTSRRVVRLRQAARLAAVLATSYFLIATSQPYDGPGYQVCEHPEQSVVFHVTGTCGPAGDVTMTSLKNDCAIAVRGGADVGLPSAGRFANAVGTVVNLTVDTWTLSSYLQEGASSPGSGADAGFFSVESDAGAGLDLGAPGGGPGTPTVTHGTLVKRECYNSYTSPLSVLCRDGSAASSCQATLVAR
jgi:hypothetical protein